MSLRLIYKLIVLALVAGVVAFAANRFLTSHEAVAQVSTDFRALTDFTEATRGSVLTVGGPPVEFALPPAAEAARILTNANLLSIDAARAQRRIDPTQRWQYAIEVEELDSSGNALQRRVHHFRRDLVEVEMPGGRRGTGSFYLEDNSPTPLPAASLRLNFPASAKPSHLRIRLISADPGIADLLVRMAVPAPSSQQKAETMWRRLSDEQRERLASGNVFPPTLLTERERASVIESRWQPVGPTGVSIGRDIYVLRGEDLGAPVEPPKPPALMAGPGRAATIQLPEKGGKVRIVLEAESDQDGSSDEITLRWLGHSAFLRQTATYKWSGSRFELQDNFGGGWLEIGATRNARVRVALIENGEERDVTPPIQYLRAWAARDGVPLDFSIGHAGSMSTPLRLVLRRVANISKRPANTPLAITFLAKDGAVIRTVRLTPQFSASRYDAPWPDVPSEFVSDPWEIFFKVPPKVTKVRITSPEPVLANAYSRPDDLPRAIRMPEDANAPEGMQTAIPGWFMVNPDAYEARILDGNSNLLMVQSRPPDDRPELVAGRYQWEDFDPTDGGAARVFLAPREEGVPDRKDAIGGTFRPIPEDGLATFIAEPGHAMVAARLAWIARAPGPFRYKVFVNDREWLSGAASGSAGEVVLPPFSPGAHHIKIISEPKVRWYANHLNSGTPWVRRRAYRFDKPMSFDIERTTLEEEFVSVRLFRPARVDSRIKLRVKISSPNVSDKIGPFPGWLFAERVYDIRPSGELALPVAETNSERTDAGQPFFIPFPKGAPQGRYRITLTPEDALSWMAVSRITPGASAKPALILENIHDDT